MKVPPGTLEYQESVRTAKTLLNRLKKGSKIMDTALQNGEMLQAKKAMELWQALSLELFTHLELATLLHQQMITGNSVVIRSDGSLEKVENLMDMNPKDIDPWTLLTISRMHEIFGEDYKNFMEIKWKETPLN